MQQTERRLYRSDEERMIFGVAGGIAEYLDADPTVVRVLMVLALLVLGPCAVLAYLALALIVPKAPESLW
jgi:phage shock protein C